MLLRLAYLTVTNALAMLRLLSMSDRERDKGILALRHELMVLESWCSNVNSVTSVPGSQRAIERSWQPCSTGCPGTYYGDFGC